MFARNFLVTMFAAAALTGCGISMQELQITVDSARACETNDDCALTDGSDCTCPFSVHKGHLDEVNGEVDSVDCGDLTLTRCDPGEAVTCLQGRCHGDALPVR